MAYHFTLMNGMPGYMPNSVHAFSADTAEEAREMIVDHIGWFIDDTGECLAWREWFNRASACPDASTWCWTLARNGAEELSIHGMTEEEARLFNEDE